MGRRRSRKPPSPPQAPIAPPAPGRRRAAAAVLALVLATGVAFLLFRGRGETRPDVLLITIDTLRADRLGCYGYGPAATPVLDALAARGVRFATAVAHAPLTAPSHASILTSLTPLRHGVRDNGAFALPSSIPTLAEAFRNGGYRTAAFVSGFPLDRRFGLDRGFDVYDDRLPHGNDRRRAPYVERPADMTTDAVLRWVDTEGGGTAKGDRPPWLLWVHYFDPHAPYEPPAAIAARFTDRPYDGEVAFVDQQVGRLLDRLRSREGARPTLVLVTADHGESLGEHGEETHGLFIYDATLLVPWILAGPGLPTGRVPTVVARGIDVAPTLLDYARLRGATGMEGRSLRPAIDGRPLGDEPAYAESLFAQRHLGWAPLRAWRTAAWKLVDAPRPELYDLATDAGETRNVHDGHGDVADGLRRGLSLLLAHPVPAASLGPTSETAERLAALGYLGGGSRPAPPSGRDPKDGVALVRRLEHGIADARSDAGGAIAALSAVLREDPGIELAYRYRAIALQTAGRFAEAVKDVEALERFGPLSTEDLVLKAEALRLAGRASEGLDALDRAARLDPRSPEPPLIKGRLLRALGRSAEAGEAFRRVLEVAPGHAEALRGLADLQAEAGILAGAAVLYEQVLARDPRDAEALVHLGVLKMRAGRVDEALPLFESAVELAPDNAQAQISLAGALAKHGRPAQAVPHFQRAIELGGRTTVALNGLGFARLEAGDAAGAMAALRASLALEPRQPPIAEAVARLARGEAP